MQAGSASQTLRGRVLAFVRRPRVTLYLLAAWSLLSAATQLFVNSGLFLDIHDRELDGAIGGFALGFEAVPLALLYLYCSRDPARYHHVFWLALVQQTALIAGNLYHLVLGTFSAESVIIPVAGSAALGALAFAQVFEAGPQAATPSQAGPPPPGPTPSPGPPPAGGEMPRH